MANGADQADASFKNFLNNAIGDDDASAVIASGAETVADVATGLANLPNQLGNLGTGTGTWAGDPTWQNFGGVIGDVKLASACLLPVVAIGAVPMIDATETEISAATDSAEESASAQCFVAGTPVQMADGTIEPVDKVHVGDEVKSRDQATGQDVDEPVLQIFVHKAAQIVDLRLSDGETIGCTPQHPFYVHGRGFVDAGNLTVGDQLTYDDESTMTSYGVPATVTVSSITAEPAATRPSASTLVYNFEVRATHTYFVGTEHGGVWVHNDCFLDPNRLYLVDENLPQELAAIMERNGINAVSVGRAFGGEAAQDPVIVDYLRDWDAQIFTKNIEDFPDQGIEVGGGNSAGKALQIWLEQVAPMFGM